MKLTKTLLTTAILLLTLVSCTKNEFDITGELKSNTAQNLRFLYYASDSKKGFIVDSPVAVVNGQLNVHGVTRNPTVVWVIDGQGRVVNLLYVERGNNLKISGELNKPWQWKVTGNKTEEELSNWMQQNGQLLLTNDVDALNKAVASYVNAHPESLAAAIMLAGLYQAQPGQEADFQSLVSKISKDIMTSPAVVAAGSLELYLADAKPAEKLDPIVLYSIDGEVDTVSPKKHSATLLYFWRKPEDGSVHTGSTDNHKFNMLALKNLRDTYGDARLQIVDINCDIDTMQWFRAAAKDSVAHWTRLWEPGYGMGDVSRRLGIPSTPYMVVADSTGRILFRGYNIAETENALKLMNK